MSRKYFIFVVLLVAGLALDQVTKALVAQRLPLGSQVPLIPAFLNLVHIQNQGAAFGMLSGWPPYYTWWFFVAVSVVVLTVLGYLLWRLPEDHWPAALGYSLILTGALGNLIDRIRLGAVVDFIDVYWRSYHWPAFNVADSLVCVGAAILVWVIIREEKTADASNPV
ncbi:MAG TPA: signal peptidase II [Desulfobaccales bacterium]|nr:signal peptidase II [Desulfobaccales bacterium]